MIFKSIRGRLLAWLAFLLVCILTGFGVTVFGLQRQNRLKQVDDELERRVAAVNADARDRLAGGLPPEFREQHPSGESFKRQEPRRFNPGGRKIVLSPSTARMFNETDPGDFYFAFWTFDAELLRTSANAPENLPFPKNFDADTLIHFRTRGPFREAFHFTETGECLLVGHSIVDEIASLRRFGLWLAAIGGAVLAIGLGGVWLFVNRAIRPVEAISNTARRIAAGNLSERIKVSDENSEFGQLASVLNSTFARLETAFTQQKHFTADASHELRTPISVLISETQTTLARERTSAEYRETIEACLDTAQQMRQLTESLLELARFDAGQEKMPQVQFDLAEKARAAIQLVHPLADARAIQITSNLPRAEISGDPDRISQVIVNLLTNAILYNKPGGKIGVMIYAEEAVVELAISDTGSGIAPEELPRVFERFYRADKARSGTTGGSGLGLAISKAIVNAHGGTILVSSKPGLGSLFMMRLPVAES